MKHEHTAHDTNCNEPEAIKSGKDQKSRLLIAVPNTMNSLVTQAR